MKSIKRYSPVITQIFIWTLLLITPYGYSVAEGRGYIDSLWMLWFLLPMYLTMAIGFYVGYFVLIPKLYLEKKHWQYFLSTFLLYYLLSKVGNFLSSLMFTIPDDIAVKPPLQWVWLSTMVNVLLNTLLTFVAIAIRAMQKSFHIEKEAEAKAEMAKRETEELESKAAEAKVAATQQTIQPAAPNYIFVKSDYKQIRIDLDDIMYVSSMKDYVRIRIESQKLPITALSTMKAIEEKLPSDRFCRIHRSHIVALDKIESVENNRVKIADQLLPVSETYVDDFDKRIKN